MQTDAARIFDEYGNLLPMHMIDDETRAAISSVELGENGMPSKIKFWSKVEAANMAMSTKSAACFTATRPCPPTSGRLRGWQGVSI